MNDQVAVRELHRVAQLQKNLDARPAAQASGVGPAVDRLAVDIFHRHPRRPGSVFTAVYKLRNVRVAKAREHAPLHLQALASELRITGGR